QAAPASPSSPQQTKIPVAITAGGEEEIEPLEDRLLGYIRSHNGELNLASCSSELSVPTDDIRRSLDKLRENGRIVTE
ncbi:hypothetical protein J2P12_02995, partial [Candidatus Bathyarchaeota archaeon]|nr:hypothetical protein [Candidatus Bathyarchaeota archaeon]